eukprot:m.243916 g.243916  ORF g.243916 m.243916 type:complete len:992 (+) comp26366_c0_seq2:209-3184(+)
MKEQVPRQVQVEIATPAPWDELGRWLQQHLDRNGTAQTAEALTNRHSVYRTAGFAQLWATPESSYTWNGVELEDGAPVFRPWCHPHMVQFLAVPVDSPKIGRSGENRAFRGKEGEDTFWYIDSWNRGGKRHTRHKCPPGELSALPPLTKGWQDREGQPILNATQVRKCSDTQTLLQPLYDEDQRCRQEAAGNGRFLDAEVRAQQKRNAAADCGPFSDAQVAAQRGRNEAAGKGRLSNAEVEVVVRALATLQASPFAGILPCLVRANIPGLVVSLAAVGCESMSDLAVFSRSELAESLQLKHRNAYRVWASLHPGAASDMLDSAPLRAAGIAEANCAKYIGALEDAEVVTVADAGRLSRADIARAFGATPPKAHPVGSELPSGTRQTVQQPGVGIVQTLHTERREPGRGWGQQFPGPRPLPMGPPPMLHHAGLAGVGKKAGGGGFAAAASGRRFKIAEPGKSAAAQFYGMQPAFPAPATGRGQEPMNYPQYPQPRQCQQPQQAQQPQLQPQLLQYAPSSSPMTPMPRAGGHRDAYRLWAYLHRDEAGTMIRLEAAGITAPDEVAACASILDIEAIVTVEDALARAVDADWLVGAGFKLVPARKLAAALAPAIAAARQQAAERTAAVAAEAEAAAAAERARVEAARAQAEQTRRAAEEEWVAEAEWVWPGVTETEARAAFRRANGDVHQAQRLLVAPSGPAVGTTGSCEASMQTDDHPPRVPDAEWTRLRDRLFNARAEITGRRAGTAVKIAKAMNLMQADYGTRFTTVWIKGSMVAELFAIGRSSFMGLTLPNDTALHSHIEALSASRSIDRDTATQLHKLRTLGNNARHANTRAFTAANKPEVVDAVYHVASLVERTLFGAPPRAAAAAPPTEVRMPAAVAARLDQTDRRVAELASKVDQIIGMLAATATAGTGTAAAAATTAGTEGRAPPTVAIPVDGFRAQVERIRAELGIEPGCVMCEVVARANTELGLPGDGTVRAQITAILAELKV